MNAPRDPSVPLTYADSGVSIADGDAAVASFKGLARRTPQKGLLGGIGGFASLFSLKDAGLDMADPVLVSGTDGVGTKLLVAGAAGMHGTIGQDLVAMCVNDVVTLGARPLFFLDYFATAKLDPAHAATVVAGIADACAEAGCALAGGETAELPGLYAPGDYDLAGFVVGVVDRAASVDGTTIRAGDRVVGIASDGVHSNGFSLARRALGADDPDRLAAPAWAGAAHTLADELLRPTRLYTAATAALTRAGLTARGMAHITGGGLTENLPRVLPAGLSAVLDTTAWPVPRIFAEIAEAGPVEPAEMRRTFNMGIGYAVVLATDDVAPALAALADAGYDAWDIGAVVATADGQTDRVSYVDGANGLDGADGAEKPA